MSSKKPSYLILAYYYFTAINDPMQEVVQHKTFLKDRDITCRIYFSEAGINGQLSGSLEDVKAYMEWMKQHPLFKDITFKIHTYHENVFPRQTVKYRKQLVALDEEVDLTQTGEYVSPAKWRELLESPNPPMVLDVRNEYEWQVGHFKGAICPPCQTFREFREYAHELKEQVDPTTTPIMMSCTGGIRCELYSSILRKNGFKTVYQLEGGVINYGLQEGSTHFLGKLFVFDDRLTIPIADEQTPVIGHCYLCQTACESYYNCANMDCNHLFLCCGNCLEEHKGCCSSTCEEAPRVRPHHAQDKHKPFRKWYHYFRSLNEAATKKSDNDE